MKKPWFWLTFLVAITLQGARAKKMPFEGVFWRARARGTSTQQQQQQQLPTTPNNNNNNKDSKNHQQQQSWLVPWSIAGFAKPINKSKLELIVPLRRVFASPNNHPTTTRPHDHHNHDRHEPRPWPGRPHIRKVPGSIPPGSPLALLCLCLLLWAVGRLAVARIIWYGCQCISACWCWDWCGAGGGRAAHLSPGNAGGLRWRLINNIWTFYMTVYECIVISVCWSCDFRWHLQLVAHGWKGVPPWHRPCCGRPRPRHPCRRGGPSTHLITKSESKHFTHDATLK